MSDQLNRLTLEDLLRIQVKSEDLNGKEILIIPDFRVAVQQTKGDRVHFIIHPSGYNGITLDFIVKGNNLVPLVVEVPVTQETQEKEEG